MTTVKISLVSANIDDTLVYIWLQAVLNVPEVERIVLDVGHGGS